MLIAIARALMTMPKHVHSKRLQQGEHVHFPVISMRPWGADVGLAWWIRVPWVLWLSRSLCRATGPDTNHAQPPGDPLPPCLTFAHRAGLGTKLATGAHPTTRTFMDVLWSLILPRDGCLWSKVDGKRCVYLCVHQTIQKIIYIYITLTILYI